MWQKYSVVRLAIPFMTGICGASLLMEHVTWRPDMLFVVMCCLLMVAVVCHRVTSHAPLFRHLFAASIFGAFLLVGATIYIIRYNDIATAVHPQQAVFRAVVVEAPQPKRRTAAVELTTTDGAHLLAYLQTDSAHSPLTLQRGDTLLFSPLHTNLTCPARRDSVAITPADTSALARYTASLFFRGISATCYVPSQRWSHTSPAQRDTTWNDRLHAYYAHSPLDSTTMSMVEALTIGRREGLSRQLRNDYSAAGVAHVLALSGMHLGLLLTLLNFLIFRFLSYEWRQRTMLAVIPLLWVFTYVAAMPSSLVRATVMATFLQVGFAFGRQYIVLNALALAAILMLAADPLQLHNVGFQLSFLSMLGVALVFKPLFLKSSPSAKYSKPIIPKLLRIVRPCLTLIMMTVSTTLFTAPVVAYHFGQLPVYSLVTNLVVPPLVMLLMWGAIAWLLLFWWPEAQAVVAHGLDVLVGVQNAVVQTIAQWPAATIQLQPTAIVVLLYYLLLAAALLFLFKYIRSKSLTA